MTKRARRNHTPAFKAKVALAAMKSDKTLEQLAQIAAAMAARWPSILRAFLCGVVEQELFAAAADKSAARTSPPRMARSAHR